MKTRLDSVSQYARDLLRQNYSVAHFDVVVINLRILVLLSPTSYSNRACLPVCLSVCLLVLNLLSQLTFELVERVWVMTIAHRGLKVQVICKGERLTLAFYRGNIARSRVVLPFDMLFKRFRI